MDIIHDLFCHLALMFAHFKLPTIAPLFGSRFLFNIEIDDSRFALFVRFTRVSIFLMMVITSKHIFGMRINCMADVING